MLGAILLEFELDLELELELELIQTHMTQKPMLRVEVGARALRGRSSVQSKGETVNPLCTRLSCYVEN